jgi:carbon-monoxide dehydrogenase large subunit
VLYLTAQALREKILTIAAAMLGLNSSDQLRMQDGRVQRELGGYWEDAGLGLTDVARTAYLDPMRLPAGMEPGLEHHKTYDPPPMTFSNATHGCEVVIDPRTGRIAIERYVVAEDCGTVLNPAIVEGQQHGAIAMGLSGALLEEIRYDETGQNLSATLADYHIATAVEIPRLEILPLHTPNRNTPAGIKGMAEGGVMGAVGAVTNAVNDALAPFGVSAVKHPLSPQYIRSIIRGSAR